MNVSIWSEQLVTIQRPRDPKSRALPSELYPDMGGFLQKFTSYFFGSDARTRTEISQLSVATGYKPAVLPLNYATIWWAVRDLNPEPTGYEPAALTI